MIDRWRGGRREMVVMDRPPRGVLHLSGLLLLVDRLTIDSIGWLIDWLIGGLLIIC